MWDAPAREWKGMRMVVVEVVCVCVCCLLMVVTRLVQF